MISFQICESYMFIQNISTFITLIHFIQRCTMHTIMYYLIKELKLQVYHFQLTSDIMLKSYKQPLNHTHLYELSDQRVPGSNNYTSTIYENNDGHVVHLSSFYFSSCMFYFILFAVLLLYEWNKPKCLVRVLQNFFMSTCLIILP